MTISEQKHRIIFIDLMRAFAVLQMVQGHTIDVLLANQFRSEEYILYAVWNFMRGLTAPIFMFTAGTVFTYLFRSVHKPFRKNPRVIKGLKRGLLLLALGYLLRYPTWTVFDFSEVSAESLRIFFAVDVLQLIGFSLFLLLLVLYLSEKSGLKDILIFSVFASLIFISSPFIEKINWPSLLPLPLAGYFFAGSGSLFPVFPWAGYVIAGGVLGSYLASNPLVFKTKRFSFLLLLFGVVLMLVSLIATLITRYLGVIILNQQTDPAVIIFRVGFVLMLNSIVSYIALKVNHIPQLLILVGRNTLLIYVVHLMILYGSAWNPGVYFIWGQSLDGWLSSLTALVMITIMALMVIILHKFKMRNKELVT